MTTRWRTFRAVIWLPPIGARASLIPTFISTWRISLSASRTSSHAIGTRPARTGSPLLWSTQSRHSSTIATASSSVAGSRCVWRGSILSRATRRVVGTRRFLQVQTEEFSMCNVIVLANHALQRTRRERRGCNRCVPCAGSLGR